MGNLPKLSDDPLFYNVLCDGEVELKLESVGQIHSKQIQIHVPPETGRIDNVLIFLAGTFGSEEEARSEYATLVAMAGKAVEGTANRSENQNVIVNFWQADGEELAIQLVKKTFIISIHLGKPHQR